MSDTGNAMSGGTKLTRHLVEGTFDSEVRDDAFDLGFNHVIITGMRIDDEGDLWLDWDATQIDKNPAI